METKHTRADEKIDKGAAFWRAYPIPPAQPLLRPEASHASPSYLRALRWSATAIVFITAAATLLWPTRSNAGGLAKSLSAFQSASFYRLHVRCLNRGKVILELNQWQYGPDYHIVFEPNGAQNLWLLSGIATSYRPIDGYAVQQRETRPNTGIAGRIDIEEIIQGAGKGGVKQFDNETWHGRTVTRYELNSGPLTDSRGVTRTADSTLIVDPITNLPIESSSENGGLGAAVCDYEYPAFDPKLMAVSLPANVPMYDLDEQRKQIEDSVTTPIAETKVAGKTISLRALVVDHHGVMAAWTTGGGPEPAAQFGKEYMKADGIKLLSESKDLRNGEGSGAGGFVPSATNWMPVKPKPEVFKGLQLINEQQSFARDTVFPDRITIRIPVWGEKSNAPMGWAVFKNVKPTLTGSTQELMWPLNVDIFVATKDQIR